MARGKPLSYRPFGDFSAEFTNPTTASAVIIPVPFDATSTWVKGADKGPAAILNASPHLEFYDIETQTEVFRHGIYTQQPIRATEVEKLVEKVENAVGYWLDAGKFPVVLGGEHSVSIGAFRAVAQRFSELTILQLDAHSDLRDEYEGSALNHACVMARAKKLCPIVQVGIRSMDISEKPAMTDNQKVFFAHQIIGQPTAEWVDKVVTQLSRQVYLTIDLDVFDPSVLPATGTPEPGGLGWYEVVKLVKTLCSRRQLVGCDLVELCPHPAHWASAFLAAKLVYKILTHRFCQPQQQ